jgi:hypothetical protein
MGRLLSIANYALALMRYSLSAKPDIVHWLFSESVYQLGLDRWVMRYLGCPGVIEWTGSDIRRPSQEMAENPYYASAWHTAYEYKHYESDKRSNERQRRYGELGFTSIAATGMMQYVQRDCFRQVVNIEQRIDLAAYTPAYPDAARKRPLVVHSPTAQVAKGTASVLKTVEELQTTLDFEFRLITGMPHAEARALVAEADIFLDQFVLGDRGIAALEAMAYGKPVICYIKPSLMAAYPADLPIVNATQDTLTTVLADLIVDGKRRRTLGEQGRAFVQTYHDAARIIPQLIEMYQTL